MAAIEAGATAGFEILAEQNHDPQTSVPRTGCDRRVVHHAGSGLRPGHQDRLCGCAERAGVVHGSRHPPRSGDGDRRDQRQGRREGTQARAGRPRRRAQPRAYRRAVPRAGRAREGRRHARRHQQRLDAGRRPHRQRHAEGAGDLPGHRRHRHHRERRGQGEQGQLPVPHRHVRNRPGQLHGRYHGEEVRSQEGRAAQLDRRLGRHGARRAESSPQGERSCARRRRDVRTPTIPI